VVVPARSLRLDDRSCRARYSVAEEIQPVGAMMPDVAEMRRFLVPTDRGIVTLQSSGVDVYEDHLIPGLTQAVAKAGHYQVWLSSIAQDLVKIRIIAYRVAPDSMAHDTPGDIVCDQQPVDFYDGTVTIRALAMGIEEHFTLPDGAGQYRVIVTTDLDSRTEMARRAMDIIGAENDPDATRARLAEYDGHEWYGVYFQYLGVIIDDEDDD
jgi:hypothetical protein